MQPKFQRKKDSSEVVFLSDKARNTIAARMAAVFFHFSSQQRVCFSAVPAACRRRREALPGRGIFAMTWRVHCRRPAAGAKGAGTPRFPVLLIPLLTPQPFLGTRLPSVARLNARGPQGRLVLQEYTIDRSGAFRRTRRTPCTDWPRTVMRGGLRKANFRALQPHIS